MSSYWLYYLPKPERDAPVNTYVEHANLSPLALGPLSSYNTSDRPTILAVPLRGRCGSMNRRRVSFSPFTFLPAILSVPWRADKSPSQQNPGWDRLHRDSGSLGSYVTWTKNYNIFKLPKPHNILLF